jgi:hypothetical protein
MRICREREPTTFCIGVRSSDGQAGGGRTGPASSR